MILKKRRCRFLHNDKWGTIEDTGTIVRWKVKEDGKLYAEIKPDEKIFSIDSTIDVVECHVKKPY